ncbi:energy-coupled thiamine transporter ThiT [Streptococcus zalophi]|uniref:Energy-coupled thiamine transporter ThiT n=1 Tax=Streptococcus zalophi TaxID=640031 RepID=A0A934UCW5_9STRE|nr:energy-coupled thiamine transporter ThiT [Streptococcus zalophi]MBJ8349172.1 energy-coupled thiamine transporter ThiT [Streptococcus zalophi]MCR8967206.1 energy-coupled thiamine transporter ThiT [Streptococcus zalophi]
MSNLKLSVLTEIAIMAALAIILDKIVLFQMPQGGSVSLTMLPIFILAFRRGLTAAVTGGLLVGFIQLFFGGYYLSVPQVLLDYILSYGGVGLAGLFYHQFKTSKNQQMFLLSLGILIGSLARLLSNVLAGIVFWSDYAPKGTPVWIYSLTYNASYLVPSAIIALVLLIILLKVKPSFFQVK